MNPFTRGTEAYKSDIKLGESYREKSTGLVGKAVSLHFYEHACERVTLRYLHDGDMKEASFDAPELEHCGTGRTPVQQASGGPVRGEGARGAVGR